MPAISKSLAAAGTGRRGAVARPSSTGEVAAIVRACAAARVGIVPWGGGTGLVGGQVMTGGPVPLLLSLERMTALRGAFPAENALVVEAGMILADVQAEALKDRAAFPLVTCLGRQLPYRRKPCCQRWRDGGPALRQRARPLPGAGGGNAGWQHLQRIEAAAEG